MSGTTAATNPLISVGTLNRIRGNIQVASFPALSISASYLGKRGFEFSTSTPATTFIDQLTGRTPSPEPYQNVTCTIYLNKAQLLAAQWEAQRLSLSFLGNVLIYTDSSVAPTYAFSQMAIENVGPIVNNGTNTDYTITLSGQYEVNAALWALTI